MYNFTDTIADPVANNSLPAEAIRYDGQWLDRVVPGFRTLSVSGRESMQSEILNRDYTTAHGKRFIRKQYPPRIITVRYQMEAASPADFRTAFNQLNDLLNRDEKKIIFYDEQTKYFIGTRQSMSETEPGMNCVTGEIEFYCSDPFKYSTSYTTETMNNIESAMITVDTIVPTPVIIEITPSVALQSVTLNGVATSTITGADSPITLFNLTASKKITINGESCTVKRGSTNVFNSTDMWEFPTFKPGSNTVVCDSDKCSITFKYKARYI